MTAPAETTAPPDNAPAIVFDVDAAVAVYRADFRDRMHRVFVINTATANPDLYNTQQADIIRDCRARGLAKHVYKKLSCDHFVYIHPAADAAQTLGADVPMEQQIRLMFDHEMGHAIYNANASPPHIRESIADAFAVLRHYQHYGIDSTAPEYLHRMRTARAVLTGQRGAMEHFTAPVIEYIIDNRHCLELDSLSPEDTLSLAVRIAHNNAFAAEKLLRLSDIFNAGAAHIDRGLTEKNLWHMQDELNGSGDHDAAAYGMSVLQNFADGKLKAPGGRKVEIKI